MHRIIQVRAMAEAVEWAKRIPFEALSRIYPGEYGVTGRLRPDRSSTDGRNRNPALDYGDSGARELLVKGVRADLAKA